MAFVAAQALIIFSCSCYLAQDMDKRRAVVNVVNEHYGSTKRTARLDKLRKCHNLIIQKKKKSSCVFTKIRYILRSMESSSLEWKDRIVFTIRNLCVLELLLGKLTYCYTM